MKNLNITKESSQMEWEGNLVREKKKSSWLKVCEILWVLSMMMHTCPVISIPECTTRTTGKEKGKEGFSKVNCLERKYETWTKWSLFRVCLVKVKVDNIIISIALLFFFHVIKLKNCRCLHKQKIKKTHKHAIFGCRVFDLHKKIWLEAKISF